MNQGILQTGSHGSNKIQVVFDIKFEPIIDISHWIEVDDFNALDPKPWLVFTKATQGENFLDVKWAEYCDMIRDALIRLGAFHYMLPGNEIRQADWFSEIVLETGLRANEPLACDMEETGITLDQIRRFNDRVQYRTGTRPVIYSTELMLEDIYPNGICPTWLNDEWLWIAEYPTNPNPYNEIPLWIVPHGCSVNKIAMWQYSADLIYPGIPGNNVDGDLISRPYFSHIGLTEPGTPVPPPPEEDHMQYKVTWEAGSNIRSRPTTSSSILGVYPNNQVVEVIRDNIPDETYPTDSSKKWVEFPNHTYGASNYGSPRMVKVEEVPPPPAGELPAYFTGHAEDGTELATYDLRVTTSFIKGKSDDGA